MAEPDVVGPEQPDTENEPLFYPCNTLGLDAPMRWLALGWQDFHQAWQQSLAYGVGLVLLGYLVTGLAWGEDNTLALFTLGVALILGLMLVRFLTAYIGLSVILPVIGHATWRAYQETVQAGRHVPA